GSTPVDVREVWPIRNQTSYLDEFPVVINRRQAPTERQGIYADSVGGSERAANHIKCLRFILKSIKGERDILRLPDFGCGDLNTEHVGFPLRLAHYQDVARIASIGHDRQSAEVGDNLAQESKSFANGVGRLERQAGDVAARPRQTCDIAARNRVERRGEDDRDSRRRLLYRGDYAPRCDNDIDLQRDELGRDLGEALATPLRPSHARFRGWGLLPARFAGPAAQNRRPCGLGLRAWRPPSPGRPAASRAAARAPPAPPGPPRRQPA